MSENLTRYTAWLASWFPRKNVTPAIVSRARIQLGFRLALLGQNDDGSG